MVAIALGSSSGSGSSIEADFASVWPSLKCGTSIDLKTGEASVRMWEETCILVLCLRQQRLEQLSKDVLTGARTHRKRGRCRLVGQSLTPQRLPSWSCRREIPSERFVEVKERTLCNGKRLVTQCKFLAF